MSAMLLYRPWPDVPDSPVFTIRPARPREVRFWQYEAMADGIAFHDVDALRDEILNALRTRWAPSEYSAGVAKLRQMWKRLDAGKALPPAQARALDELGNRLARECPRLREMAADNREFQRAAPRIAASMMLDGWSGIAVPVSRVAGRIPAATLDELERALAEIARTAAPAEPEGQAFVDLQMAALLHANGGPEPLRANHQQPASQIRRMTR